MTSGQLVPRGAYVVHLGVEVPVPLLERRELLERERVDRAQRGQLAVELVRVLGERRVLGRSRAGHPASFRGSCRAPVGRARGGSRRAARPRSSPDRGGGCGCAPHRVGARWYRGPDAATPGARRPPAPRRPGSGSRAGGPRSTPSRRPAPPRPPARRRVRAARSRRAGGAGPRGGPLVGVTLEAPLDLVATLGQDPPPLGQSGRRTSSRVSPRGDSARGASTSSQAAAALLDRGRRDREPWESAAACAWRPWAAASWSRASSSSTASRAVSATARCTSARPASSAARWRSRARSAAALVSRQRASARRRSASPARASSGRRGLAARRPASSTAAAVTTAAPDRTRQPVAANRSPSGVTTTRSS